MAPGRGASQGIYGCVVVYVRRGLRRACPTGREPYTRNKSLDSPPSLGSSRDQRGRALTRSRTTILVV
eukprot:9503869-Pyramimonas_sp.AAC.2